ncbi:flagellar operon protein [Natranaerovirga pectinivora]|uniref:Flagellar operon protein n=1 Tax=Natranaerovirga pectinivora TaxID=682400 RepID=A0A4V6NZU8_9FIRM|nr:TIGR02530 family flagellar biosynthesis protein [Natranaerovirga pectinivora]TCT16427.1 flagellar operon protein [Natranaerovirga pectinivora]
MKIQKHHFPPIQVERNREQDKVDILKGKKSFESVLQEQIITKQEGIKFSKHANERLLKRNIELTQNQMERLEDGVLKAKTKGIKESLVLMDNIAFVINIPNQTVITAMEQESTEEQIFSNIDGAVIL